MSLADYEGGGMYLQAGHHRVRVTDFRIFQYNSGNDGVEFEVKDERGMGQKVSFVLVDKAFWRLANFARACGISDAEMKAYEPSQANSHTVLINRWVMVSVVPQKDGKYHEVGECWKDGGTAPAVAAPSPEPEVTPSPAGRSNFDPDRVPPPADSDIPF